LTDISPLAGLPSLSRLDLSFCQKLTDISPLVGLPNLTAIVLSYCKNLIDLSPLVEISSLRSLYLGVKEYHKYISALAGLTNLSIYEKFVLPKL
jgi:internalin A